MKIYSKIEKIICVGFLYVFGLFVFLNLNPLYSNNRFGKIGGVIFLVLVPIIVLLHRHTKYILYALVTLFSICLIHNVYYFDDFMSRNDGNRDLINTQSYWYSSINQVNRDVLIYTLLRDKTAVITMDSCWYYRFIAEFSGDVELNSSLDPLYFCNIDFYDAGAIRMRTLKDLFDEETYRVLDERTLNEQYQHLYVDVEGVAKSTKVYVYSDNEYNIFLVGFNG